MLRGFENVFYFLRRLDVSGATQVAALRDEFVFRVRHVEVAIVEAVVAFHVLVERQWPRGKHDGFAALFVRHIRGVTHAVPEFLRDERQERMEQTDDVRENEINHRERVRLASIFFLCRRRREESLINFCFFSLSLVTSTPTGQDGFARLHIPVAILVPEKFIERGGGFAELVFVQRDGDFADGGGELEQNPFVIRGEQGAFDPALNFKYDGRGVRRCARGGRAPLYLAETAGVPELVAEIAAEFHVLLVEEHVLAERRAAHGAEAEGVRAVLGDEFERVGRIAERLRHLAALLVADDAG